MVNDTREQQKWGWAVHIMFSFFSNSQICSLTSQFLQDDVELLLQKGDRALCWVTVASVWVFIAFKYWLIVIEQTAHNLRLSTSLSALNISGLPPVTAPAAASASDAAFSTQGLSMYNY
jgi:hypothetical protein